MKIFTVAQMIAAEKAANIAGTSYAQMMERAGKAVAQAILKHLPVAEKNILILVGSGNNGGDGLVAGRYLAQSGATVTFYLSKPRNPQTDKNYAHIQQMGLRVIVAQTNEHISALRTQLNITDILLDGLLGTGVSHPISGHLAQLLQQVHHGLAKRHTTINPQAVPRLKAINDLPVAHSAPPPPFIVAIDCPSGLNCDTGSLDPLALTAHVTVTFAGPKRGHFIFPGATACGQLLVADIGIDPQLPVVADIDLRLMTAKRAQTLLPVRPAEGHKGRFGKVLIVAGCDLYRGAPVLAARGAFRAGSGLVELAVPKIVRHSATVQLPEATYLPIVEECYLSADAATLILQNAHRYKGMVIGPGLGDVPEFLDVLLAGKDRLPPLLVDADGLNLLAKHQDWHKKLPPNIVLTPHLGEMARLMGISLTELQGLDRVAVVQEMARKWGHVVLLKGAYTAVAHPNGQTSILPFANAVLAVAGSGDVLSGVIVSLLGQGLDGFAATTLGGYLHGATTQVVPQNVGVLAHELADLLPAVMAQLEQG